MFVNMNLRLTQVCRLEMVRPIRSAIEQFVVLTQKPYLVGFIDINNNDAYIPKEGIMSKWIVISEKNEDGSLLLYFTYELNTPSIHPKK